MARETKAKKPVRKTAAPAAKKARVKAKALLPARGRAIAPVKTSVPTARIFGLGWTDPLAFADILREAVASDLTIAYHPSIPSPTPAPTAYKDVAIFESVYRFVQFINTRHTIHASTVVVCGSPLDLRLVPSLTPLDYSLDSPYFMNSALLKHAGIPSFNESAMRDLKVAVKDGRKENTNLVFDVSAKVRVSQEDRIQASIIAANRRGSELLTAINDAFGNLTTKARTECRTAIVGLINKTKTDKAVEAVLLAAMPSSPDLARTVMANLKPRLPGLRSVVKEKSVKERAVLAKRFCLTSFEAEWFHRLVKSGK